MRNRIVEYVSSTSQLHRYGSYEFYFLSPIPLFLLSFHSDERHVDLVSTNTILDDRYTTTKTRPKGEAANTVRYLYQIERQISGTWRTSLENLATNFVQ